MAAVGLYSTDCRRREGESSKSDCHLVDSGDYGAMADEEFRDTAPETARAMGKRADNALRKILLTCVARKHEALYDRLLKNRVRGKSEQPCFLSNAPWTNRGHDYLNE